jgi:hypothetical protein
MFMYEDTAVDDALDRLDEAVCNLTSSSSIDALQRIVNLAHTATPVRDAVDQVHDISALCSVAHGALIEGLDAIEQDRDEDAVRSLDRALFHLHTVAGLVEVEHDGRDADRQAAVLHPAYDG